MALATHADAQRPRFGRGMRGAPALVLATLATVAVAGCGGGPYDAYDKSKSSIDNADHGCIALGREDQTISIHRCGKVAKAYCSNVVMPTVQDESHYELGADWVVAANKKRYTYMAMICEKVAAS